MGSVLLAGALLVLIGLAPVAAPTSAASAPLDAPPGATATPTAAPPTATGTATATATGAPASTATPTAAPSAVPPATATPGPAATPWLDTSVADFARGAAPAGLVFADVAGGAVRRAAALEDYFDGPVGADRWRWGTWNGATYSPAPSGGVLAVRSAGGTAR